MLFRQPFVIWKLTDEKKKIIIILYMHLVKIQSEFCFVHKILSKIDFEIFINVAVTHVIFLLSLTADTCLIISLYESAHEDVFIG